MVKAWRENISIPTYEIASPELAPMFLEKRVYQGSSGVVYPYPVIEGVSDVKTDHVYEAVWLENEYIKVMILPELGGRVQQAYDKVAKRHFVYCNNVIKPALVGLAGPWISGGIEFNWPQHHRPSTFMPVDSMIEENEDGSVTVWVSERERMTHQKGMAGLTLRPGAARLEIKGRLFNPTDLPQTFLWWANPAVAVNDAYRSVFPPDINAVFDHGKRAVSTFPIATGTYYKMDYSSGVDISNYRNIKVPTSYMGVNSRYDFEGGYEEDTNCGMLHVASRHVSPGKKQWTWGNGDFGQAWDRNLTDNDGPYIELMAGVFTENQPDFSWLMPYEEKRFTQYFFPYRELGVVKNANRDLVMNFEKAGEGNALLRIFAVVKATGTAVVRSGDREIARIPFSAKPTEIVELTVDIDGANWYDLSVELTADGCESLRWRPEPDEARPIPDAAEAAKRPEEIKSNDRLYLTGLHLEQYRHATFNPTDYYLEALRRDPADTRCNNAMGVWLMRRGCFAEAEPYLRRAVGEWRRANPNPYDGEPLFNLAVTLRYLGREDEAYDLYAKACWNAAWASAGNLGCAMIDCGASRYNEALRRVDDSIIANPRNHRALALRAEILLLAGQTEEAAQAARYALDLDGFNFAARWTLYRATDDDNELGIMVKMMRDCSNNYDTTALDLAEGGSADAAVGLWKLATERGAVTPMTYYYSALTLSRAALPGVDEALDKAAATSPDYCFPKGRFAALALRSAIAARPQDGLAHYLLGCLLYDARRHEEAIGHWRTASAYLPDYPLVWRNLALGLFNKLGSEAEALAMMEKAMSLNPDDARMLMELDQLRKRLGHSHDDRLAALDSHAGLLPRRDDLILEKATLLNQLGRYREAADLIGSRRFHPWEGGEGKVAFQYQTARTELAKQALSTGRHEEARTLLKECLEYPDYLGEGKLHGAQENDFNYLLGVAAEMAGDEKEARRRFELAVEGPTEPAPALYYNDAKPDKIFYQGLALLRLGRDAEARGRFNRLVAFGEKHLFEPVTIDYFAVSLPDLLIWEDNLDRRNRVHCRYMMALGYYGLGKEERALRELARVEDLDHNHQGAAALRSMIKLNLQLSPCHIH
ncbi:MAG: DUF5107 domain-containing protein [Paramuribaculum sp.]|nr:DUF5107 domain-containing protein [Paramuribaculum sp.]